MPLIQNILLSTYATIGAPLMERSELFRRFYEGSYTLYKGFVEDPFAKLVKRHPELFHRGSVLDIGANIGYTAALFSKALPHGFKVYACEPEATNLCFLRKKAERRENLRVIACAVGAKDGVCELAVNKAHPADHKVKREGQEGGTAEVALRSVQSLVESGEVEGPLAFVKIDVQGFEREVLRGMEGLSELPRAVAIEIHPPSLSEFNVSWQELCSWFLERGYEGSFLGDKELTPYHEQALQEKVKRRGYVDLLWQLNV